MKFSLIAVSAFFTLTLAAYKQPTTQLKNFGAVRLPDSEHPVTAGKDFEIVWDAEGLSTKPISLLLLHGCPSNCSKVLDIITGIPSNHQLRDKKGTFKWNVPQSLQDSNGKLNYGIQLVVDDTGEFQYSMAFAVVGGLKQYMKEGTGKRDVYAATNLGTGTKGDGFVTTTKVTTVESTQVVTVTKERGYMRG